MHRQDSVGTYEFYVESIVHHYVENEQATTTLGLTRGLTEEQYRNYQSLLLKSGLEPVAGEAVRAKYKRILGVK